MNWISVKDRLPEEQDRVLVFGILSDGGEIARHHWIAYYRPLNDKPQWILSASFGSEINDVEYWMKLPMDPMIKKDDNGN